jgi:hypothetical protein
MTETIMTNLNPAPEAPPKLGISAEQIAALTPEVKAQLKGTLEQAGFDSQQIATAFTPPAAGENFAIGNGPGFDGLSTGERERGYNTLWNAATTDSARAQILAAAAKDGVVLKDQNGNIISADPNTRAQYAYSFNYMQLPEAQLSEMAEDRATLDAGFKQGFAALQIPQALAQRCIEAFVKSAELYRNEDDPETLAPKIENDAMTLRSMSNGPELQRLRNVGTEYIKKTAPQFHEWLSSNLAFYSLQSQIILAQVGQYVEARNKGKR